MGDTTAQNAAHCAGGIELARVQLYGLLNAPLCCRGKHKSAATSLHEFLSQGAVVGQHGRRRIAAGIAGAVDSTGESGERARRRRVV